MKYCDVTSVDEAKISNGASKPLLHFRSDSIPISAHLFIIPTGFVALA